MKRASAPGYDLFKLVVTLILIILLMWVWSYDHKRGPKHNVPPPISPATAQPTETVTPIPSVSATALLDTLEPTATATIASPSPTPMASPTTQPPTPTPSATAPAPGTNTTSCATSSPSRLQVGQQARVLSNLNMRTEPSISADIIKTNLTSTLVEIIGGPVCTPQGNGAYLWWHIRLNDGREGWSAETALIQKNYFLEPVP